MSYDLLFRRAVDFHQNGEFDKAEMLYRQILETVPENPEVLNLLGLIAQIKGIHQEAAGLFYRAIKADGSRAPFHFNLGISLNCWNKPYEALEAFSRAAELDSSLKEAWLQIGNIRQELHQTAEAEKAYDRALKIDPGYAEAQLRKILLAPQTALSQLQTLQKQFPEEPLIDFELARIFLARNDYPSAQLHARKAVRSLPDSSEPLTLLGQACLAGGQITEAENCFTSALQISPNDIFALINLANIETGNQQYELAEAHYRRAIELDAKNFDARLNHGTLLYRQQRLSEALEEYRQAVILNPKSAEASNNLGLILRDIREYEEALGLFFNAYALNPELEEISVNLAETLTLYHRQEPQTALKIAENWLRQAPENVFAAHTVAALGGKAAENDCAYAQKLFDHFAGSYDATLRQIQYALPQEISRRLGNVQGKILDLGCGTGLLGECLKTSENRITGIDLSAEMLKRAKTKNIYEQLIKTDIISYLSAPHPSFDQITAADVFCYFSDLRPILEKCFPTPVCFSVEDGDSEKNWQIAPSGRYRHSVRYVNKLLSSLGYTSIQRYSLPLRHENGTEVRGTLFIAGTPKEKTDAQRRAD